MSNKQEIKETVKKLVNLTNGARDQEVKEGIKKGIELNHRTLQQSFFRGLKGAIKEYGEKEHYDQRNKGAVEWCQEVAEVSENLPYI